MKKYGILIAVLIFACQAYGQRKGYWQQHVDYKIIADVDASSYQYDGQMELKYTNNSGQSLDNVFFHLYFNAFQPGSMMDYRLIHIADPDRRMTHNRGTKENPDLVSRIAELSPDQIGYQKIETLEYNGKPAEFSVSGTILRVDLPEAIQPGETGVFTMTWNAQVPEQIRRSGRNSAEGVSLSMTQWYPKMAQFDEFGWHLDEYIGREFIAPFGNFDVTINIDKEYVIGGSGVLQNPNQVKGYDPSAKIQEEQGKATWHFKAENIHDFAWAADPEFIVDSTSTKDQVKLYALHIPKNKTMTADWHTALEYTAAYFDFVGAHFGAYPWPAYTIVQGGDGGMEYGMATLVTGERKLNSLIGVIFHEVAHSWYQQLFGINETVDEWFDEGFTSLIADMGEQVVVQKKELEPNPAQSAYKGYINLALSGKEEPASLLADYYDLNYAYSQEAYNKGQVFAVQLGYIIGQENLEKTFKRFYELWKFKHPTPNDFKRVAEQVSGINLKWYTNLFLKTTRQIDYSISKNQDGSFVIQNKSNFAMPIDLLVEYTDGSKELFYIPLREMRGEKPEENLEMYQGVKRTVLEDWFWTKPTYTLQISKPVKNMTIDPSLRLADVHREDNQLNP